ncbi:hypothetical protein EV191_12021 [Tamaricihabitans halophyticus]|uniref:Uncharacterized protein n=1 Tax=Tamaricihabitans halophyticus TaxID=1262583 RepID=A0A4R2Q5H0_9PSEU|nr:hypothetical protein [Tamaricihabitans halophyticus]TCP43867.1 hypothetical protein EV191_12021 [Tamaricihabitans halophyticus]
MSWSDDMDTHCATFQEVWSENWSDAIPIFMDDLEGEFNKVDSQLQDMFTAFKAGDPEPAEQAVAALSGVKSQITEDMHQNLNGLDLYLEDWRGDAADNFRRYTYQMKDALMRKQECVSAAEQAMLAYQQMMQSYRDAILGLIESSQAAMDKIDEANEMASDKVKLSIIATVVAVGAALTAGAAAPVLAGVGAALVAGGTSYQILTMQAEKKGEVIVKMIEEGDKILAEVDDAKERVSKAFFAVTEYVTNVNEENLPDVRPERPDIVTDDKFDPDDFYHDDQPDGIADDMRTDGLVEEPRKPDDNPRDRRIVDPDAGFWDLDRMLPSPDDAYPEQ